MSIQKDNFDTNLYSRQLGVYGAETMKKIIKLNVFIYGMRGLGVEIAKNFILAGPKKVTIYDPNITKINDLTSNFYLTKEDVENQRRRDESIIEKLRELNHYVQIEIMKENNIIENLEKCLQDKEYKYDVVLISEFISKEEIIKINNICRKNNIGFIYTAELGIYGFCFVDFGDNFLIKDENGNDPLSYCIKSITKEKRGVVTIDTTAGKLKLGNNDKVVFKEIEGMKELNNCQPIKIKVLSNNSVEIGDTSNFSDYISGGIMTEVKLQKECHFESIEEKFEIPFIEGDEPKEIDYSKLSVNEIIHIGILALNKYYIENNCLPLLNNLEQAKEVVKYGKEIYENKSKEKLFWLENLEDFEDFDIIFEKTLLRLSLWSRAEISPITSFLGGVSAQEIVKYTGKYNPIHQWIWFDFSETVENIGQNINRELKNDRYDDQIAIYGNEIQEKLSNSNIFIIGAGALGCEFLKSFALMGISSNKEKKVIITDNDNIEISNLNRQFLFRQDDVGQSKSIIACNASMKMNSDFNCYAMKSKIGIENETIFDEEFWEKQDYIINAVDNVEARLYISNQSTIYKKILIDSGTLGTIANSQVVIPNKTVQYTEPPKEDIEQRAIAMCTLRNFPTLISHCIEWARDKFDGYFVNIIQYLKKFCENKENLYKDLEAIDDIDLRIKDLEKIMKYTKLIINRKYDDCLEIAFNEYIQKFNNDIIQILMDNPLDSLNEDGSKFWSANKRAPIPLPFDVNNQLIILYIKKYADILSNSLSIPINEDIEYIKKKCESFEIKEFIPTKTTVIIKNRYKQGNDEETIEEKKLKKQKKKEEILLRLKKQKENFDKVKERANKIILPNYNDISQDFKIQEFEKDDDLNGHVEFLYAASNLRAQNFRIENCDIYKVKTIAGKITPSIATTTASIVGLVSLQFYTLKQNYDINYLRDCNFNLAFNNYMFISPSECEFEINAEENKEKIKYIPEEFTIWDFIEINQSITIREFINYVKENYNVKITSISSNNLNLFELNKQNDKIDSKIEEIYNEISKYKLFEKKRFLILDVLGDCKGLTAKMPKFKYNFKK